MGVKGLIEMEGFNGVMVFKVNSWGFSYFIKIGLKLLWESYEVKNI